MANRELATTTNYEMLGSRRLFMEPPDTTIGTSNRDFIPSAYREFNDKQKLEFLLSRQLVTQMLGVGSFRDIDSTLFTDPIRKNTLNKEIIERYGAMNGLSHRSHEETTAKLRVAFDQADAVINTFENQETGMLRHLRTSIGQTNEVTAMKDPIDLLLVLFSPKSGRKLRFEARRKLILMDISFRSNLGTEDHDKQIDDVLHYLNTTMWKGGTGVTQDVEVISQHNPRDYSCQSVRVLGPDDTVIPSAHNRYTKFQMREWVDRDGNKRLVYVEHRLKDPAARAIKLMRKDTKDPAKIDDYLGLKFVFQTKKEISEFLFTLQNQYMRSGSMIYFDEYYDTIANGDDYKVTNPGSSNKLEIVKVHTIINGARVEFQMHTVRSFLDSRYHDERGFEIFAIKRLFEGAKNSSGGLDPGVIDLLYPADIYGKDVLASKDALMDERKTAQRNAASSIPRERTANGLQYQRYTSEELLADMLTITDQMNNFYPDQIVALGDSGHFMAVQLSNILGGIPIVEYHGDENIDSRLSTLIVNGVTRDGTRIKALKKKLPQAKIAVIAQREVDAPVPADYVARRIEKDTWFNYFWEMPDLNVSFAQAAALFYRVNESGAIEFLVEQALTAKGDKDLKLLGGKKSKTDSNLHATVVRELREETGKNFDGARLKPLDTMTYKFPTNEGTLPEDRQTIQKGFIQAFAHRVGPRFSLPVLEPNETKGYVWVTSDQFKERSMWHSYAAGIDQWMQNIAEIEAAHK